MPDFNINDFAVFKMIFTPVTGEDSVTIERKGEELYRPVNLAVGSWQLVVNAYKNASDTQETMSGAYVGPDGKPAIINIREQATTSGVVVLRPFINEGQGIFSWTINYPANYPAGFAGIEIQMEIISLSADGTDNYEDTISVGITGSRTLNSGYYRVIVSMIDGLRSTAQSSILHIYRNMTSSAVFNFTPENFVTPAMPPFTVSDAQSWAAAVASIQSGGRYIIDVTNSFPIPGTNLPTFGNVTGIHVTIRGINNPSSNSNHAISLNSQGTLLNINSNQEIILQDINLVGLSWNSPNNSPLVHVGSGASFTLRGTSSLLGNSNPLPSNNGGGVHITSGATFNMQGSTSVSGNSSSSGGGVYIDGGIFTMHDSSTISGNNSSSSGGGVYIDGGTFTMRDNSSISGNNSSSSGGGIFIFDGDFRISGGIVYGNDAGQLNNTSSSNIGAALFISQQVTTGTARFGPNGTEYPIPAQNGFRDETIHVINGVLQ